MGGIGSGQYSRWEGGKELADDQRALDINFMNRSGFLKPGTVWTYVWHRNGEPCGQIYGASRPGERILLMFNSRLNGGEWKQVKQEVQLVYTQCHFGGKGRPWFLCPGVACGRRVGKLFGVSRLFLCRHCYDLAYASQREGRKDGRLLERARTLRKQLLRRLSASERQKFRSGYQGVGSVVPRPKGMHWKTYESYLDRIDHLELEGMAVMTADMEQSMGRLLARHKR